MYNDEIMEQYLDELVQLRREIGGVADRLNNALTSVFGNISLAKIYIDEGESGSKVLERLSNAEAPFLEIKQLTYHLLNICHENKAREALTAIYRVPYDSKDSIEI